MDEKDLDLICGCQSSKTNEKPSFGDEQMKSIFEWIMTIPFAALIGLFTLSLSILILVIWYVWVFTSLSSLAAGWLAFFILMLIIIMSLVCIYISDSNRNE